jgi:hypothetical protein
MSRVIRRVRPKFAYSKCETVGGKVCQTLPQKATGNALEL